MSILIKGMEMPKDGREHKALMQFLKNGACRVVVEYSTSYADRHIKVFPVETVPAFYDRLISDDTISREAAREFLSGAIDALSEDGISSHTAEDLAAYLLKTIENIPPAYYEEDRNG